jgi:hypothetical protein
MSKEKSLRWGMGWLILTVAASVLVWVFTWSDPLLSHILETVAIASATSWASWAQYVRDNAAVEGMSRGNQNVTLNYKNVCEEAAGDYLQAAARLYRHANFTVQKEWVSPGLRDRVTKLVAAVTLYGNDSPQAFERRRDLKEILSYLVQMDGEAWVARLKTMEDANSTLDMQIKYTHGVKLDTKLT